MRKAIKGLALLLGCMVIGLTYGMEAQAAEVPYQTYTYDKWNNATPAPNGYLPVRNIMGNEIGCGDFSDASDLFYCKARGEIYISDTGNSRILVLDEKFELKKELSVLIQADGEEYYLTSPKGVFVQEDGTIYIAEYGNQEIVICDSQGMIERILDTPDSTLLPDNFNYLPKAIVVDAAGRIYVLSQGIYQGLIYLEPDGTFIKFFGANDVEMTWQRRVMKLWKSILSDKAAATMQAFNPIEYGNIYLAEDAYIYAVAAASETGASQYTKLNPLGIDFSVGQINPNMVFSDITVDENGTITVIDSISGVITQLDENGKMMFAFGGIGNQVGLFQKPVSIIEVKEHMYVLDSDKNMITEFELTQFGEKVRTAINLYNDGLYEESIGPWEEVIRSNANYLLAYTGLGKAYYQLEDYDTAMYYFKMANDRSNYSNAFKEASLNHIRESFGPIVLAIVVLIVAVIVLRRVLRKRKSRKGAGRWAALV